MHTKPFQYILTFLALLGTAHAHVAPIAKCTAQAWVRAPDLAPDTIVRGDARVKISAECPDVETVLLGLRLKERSFVKALRSQADREWMRSAPLRHIDMQQTSPWAFPQTRVPNRIDDVKFDESLADKELWLVREEERVVFETTRVIHMEEGPIEDRVVVQEFAVLVPSTNFPPALDYSNPGFIINRRSIETIDVESIYEYFIRISFANGTTEHMSAGFTGFQPLYDPTDTRQVLNSETVGLKAMPGEYSPVTNYTAQISSLVFTEGSDDQVATIVITRTGPARIFTAPLTVRGCVEPTFSSKWAVEYDITIPNSQPMHRPRYVLRSTPENVQDRKLNSWRPSYLFNRDGTAITMPNSTNDEIQSHEIVTTTSAAVTIPIKINRRHISNFETYYQTLANSLQITLETPRTADETVDPDVPSAEVPSSWRPDFPDDDEPWVPWEKAAPSMSRTGSWATYSGSVPAVVRPIGEGTTRWRCFGPGADMSGQVVLQGEKGCEQHSHSSIHYLDDGARGPVFVDPSIIQELLAEDPAERELRAPILEPVVSSPPEGEEQVYRYYSRFDRRAPLIYVGETWAKKVAIRGEQKVSSVYKYVEPMVHFSG
ncbi:hypothetical protein L210DRAFT_3649099 [Boletus edulis BED1]|uniref:Uncharacterized protein n=1 Tax=Boletus edulis BED1 TaxID=1328754 RepID=A0AAD4BMY4_BOLED|nr:hypothetical protein L210DRAFT_3649099 [Boletus edulis BED1]